MNYFRPIWTCGRYNKKARVAIYYNLIEGMSYFYEYNSADVVSYILKSKRGEEVKVNKISGALGISEDCIIAFFNNLVLCGLLTKVPASNDFIQEYRIAARDNKTQIARGSQIKMQEQSTVGNPDTAENEYAEKIDGISSVMFELTYNCSEMCLHCYNPGATRNNEEKSFRGARQELDIDDYKRIIDELYDLGLSKVCLSGGDPFSKDIAWDIIDYLYQKDIAFDIFTNGQRVYTLDCVRKIADYFPRIIGVSLYSDVPHVHDSITRIKGSHDKTIEFLENCYSFGLSLNIKCCIMKPNVKTYGTVKNVAYKLGAVPQFDLNITDSLEGDKCASNLLRLSHNELEIVLRDKELPYYISNGQIKSLSDLNVSSTEKMCNAGFTSFCITPEGILQPCCAYPLRLGDTKKHSIKHILKNSNELHWIRSKRIGDCIDCMKHDYCVFCQRCAGNNYNSNGTPLEASENNCYIAKERYELAKKMNSGYDPLCGKKIQDCLDELDIVINKMHRMESVNHRHNNGIKGV